MATEIFPLFGSRLSLLDVLENVTGFHGRPDKNTRSAAIRVRLPHNE